MVRFRFELAIVVAVAVFAIGAVGPLAAQQPEKKTTFAQAPLLKEPTTPEGMFASALLMVDLARLDLAAKYLEQFQATSPDDGLLLKLRDKHGTGDFLRLAQTRELQPLSTQLLEQLNEAAKKQAEDPVFVGGLIQRLTEGPQSRDLAIVELRNAGVGAVPEIIKAMSQEGIVEHQDTFVICLTRMGSQVIPPLIGALDTPLDRVRAAVIDALGWLDAKEAIPYLWFPSFDETQPKGVRIAAKRTLAKLLKGSPERATQLSSIDASNELRRLAKLLYRKPSLLPVDDSGSVNLWGWNDESGTVSEKSFTPEIASLFLSTRFARQSLSLSPEQPEPQRQYLASLLGLEVLRDGWEKPRLVTPGSAMYLGLTSGEDTVSQVLSEAIEAGHPATAVAALELLSQIGTREQLITQSGLKSPVIAAINFPDPRVQFAAATTILKLDPKTGFRGANRVVDILARSITDPGQSQALVIDADNRRASQTVGYLADAGYEGIITATGRDGFERASKSIGIEIIVVHVNCMRWDLSQTMANLRADSRTAAIPVVVYGPVATKGDTARLVTRHSPATYVSESASSPDFLHQVTPFLKNLKTPPLSPQERDLHKKAGIYWLATIGSGSLSRIFDISKAEPDLTIAVEEPEFSANALVALAGIGTGSAQRRIADVATNAQMNEAIREVAAGQLAYHIQHYGLLLNHDEVIDVHEGWKRANSPSVKSALAVVIGSLKPNSTVVGERLQQFPTPSAN